MRPEIQALLERFRRSIRRYVLLEGLAVALALGCLLFWVSFGIDLVHYQFRKLELPGGFRVAVTLVMTVLLVGVTLNWLLMRMLRPLRDRDLALALERRNPVLNDRLLTSVELSKQPLVSPVQREMVNRTTEDAARAIAELDLQSTFDFTPLRRILLAAGVLVASVLVFGLTNAQAMERWYDAYIRGSNSYWEPFRRNAVKVHVIAQPGDRVREFDAHQVYRHPRGADLQFVAKSLEETVPPERATLQYLTFGSGKNQRGRITMSQIREGEFRHTISRVVDDHQLWITAGDYVNRSPFRIQVVDPPQIDQLLVAPDYPEYIGWDGQEDRLLPVVGTQISLPMETAFELVGKFNKPILNMHVRSKQAQLTFGFQQLGEGLTADPTRLTLTDEAGGEAKTILLNFGAQRFFNAERMEFRIPFRIRADYVSAVAAIDADATEIPLPPDVSLQISLVDEDLIYSPEPTTVKINGIVDEPPVVDTQRTGIGSLITRVASIPVKGTIRDDYGVQAAWFGYRVDTKDQARSQLARQPNGQSEFKLSAQAVTNSNSTPSEAAVERFNLIPLKLQEGQTLTLGVYAADGDTINGPHETHGELFSFKIVSQDELLDRMYDREMNLRMRFEQIRSEVDDLKQRLGEQRAVISANETAEAAEIEKNRTLLSSFVERGLHQLRKNHTESRSIEVSFRDLREELVNNRIDTQELLDRIDNGVIAPLAVLNGEAFLEADRAFGVMRIAVERNRQVMSTVDAADPAIAELLRQMDKILAEMRDRGTYNDLIQNLQQIIETQKKLLEETEDQRIQKNFFFPVE